MLTISRNFLLLFRNECNHDKLVAKFTVLIIDTQKPSACSFDDCMNFSSNLSQKIESRWTSGEIYRAYKRRSKSWNCLGCAWRLWYIASLILSLVKNDSTEEFERKKSVNYIPCLWQSMYPQKALNTYTHILWLHVLKVTVIDKLYTYEQKRKKMI